MFTKLMRYIQRRRAERAAPVLGHGVSPGVVVGSRGPMAVGRLVVSIRAPGGDWCVHDDSENLVVTQAETLMAQMAIEAVGSGINYIELGDPSPAQTPELINTNLQQTTGERKVVSRTAVGNVCTFEATWLTTEGNGFTFTESGLFVGTPGSGVMFARKVFAGITKTASFELKFTWYITFLVNSQGGECSGVSLIGPATITPRWPYVATGGEASIGIGFDFSVGSYQMLVSMNGVLLVPSFPTTPVAEYTEVNSASLVAPVGGIPTNKGINLIGFTANAGDRFMFYLHTLA